jgi:hypothetical protein
MGNWYKVVGRKGPNIYALYPPADPILQPDWSGLPSFDEMLLSAFDSHMIEDLNHPLLRKARGYHDSDEYHPGELLARVVARYRVPHRAG